MRCRDLRFERHWTRLTLPRRRLVLTRHAGPGFDLTAAIDTLCRDIALRCEAFRYIDMNRVLTTAIVNRRAGKYGVHARVTPMRFRGAAQTRRHRGHLYGLQRYYVDDREMMYLLTFVLPRYLDQSFEEKLMIVFHELYHMSPAFDGDIRRHEGRYSVHSRSKDDYDARMYEAARDYLRQHPDPGIAEFLKWDFAGYCERSGGVIMTVVPNPKMFPITRVNADIGGNT
jgi:predicted metallopeptidase